MKKKCLFGKLAVLSMLTLFLFVQATTAFAFAPEPPPPPYSKTTPDNQFCVVSYNVAGLPEPLSGSEPITNTKPIGEKLNAFDIALVQEDFAYHIDLAKGDGHPYDSGYIFMGDGLSTFSYCPFTNFTREAWLVCYGVFGHLNDCLTPKGFTRATHELAPGVFIDIYDLHMDAGDSQGDFDARRIQVNQLIRRILSASQSKALIVAGDFNMSYSGEGDVLLGKLMDDTGLLDARRELGIGGDRIDKILYRSGTDVTLIPVNYTVEYDHFKDSSGDQLSDHTAISALFQWE